MIRLDRPCRHLCQTFSNYICLRNFPKSFSFSLSSKGALSLLSRVYFVALIFKHIAQHCTEMRELKGARICAEGCCRRRRMVLLRGILKTFGLYRKGKYTAAHTVTAATNDTVRRKSGAEPIAIFCTDY